MVEVQVLDVAHYSCAYLVYFSRRWSNHWIRTEGKPFESQCLYVKQIGIVRIDGRSSMHVGSDGGWSYPSAKLEGRPSPLWSGYPRDKLVYKSEIVPYVGKGILPFYAGHWQRFFHRVYICQDVH